MTMSKYCLFLILAAVCGLAKGDVAKPEGMLKKEFLRVVTGGNETERKLGGGLGLCQSDCDTNNDCQSGLVCYQRRTQDPMPPCCSGGKPSDSRDFCVPQSGCTGTSPAPPSGGGSVDNTEVNIVACFSGDTLVDVFERGMVPMDKLNVGDLIRTGSKEYQPVYSFGHYHPTKEAEFLVLETDDNKSMEVTSDHLIFVEGKSNPVRASSIQTGDKLQPFGVTVTEIGSVTKTGIYTPLTVDGTLMVNDNILASSYSTLLQDTDEYAEFKDGTQFISQHTGIHMLLTHFRILCRATTFNFCQSYNDDGLPHHVADGISILKWINDNLSTPAQATLFAVAFPVFGTLLVLESLVFGGGLLVLAGLLVWRYATKQNVSNLKK